MIRSTLGRCRAACIGDPGRSLRPAGPEPTRLAPVPGEGFVNQYVQDEGSTPARVVFTSEAIENIAAGCRARETYVVHGPDDIEELFELAPPGKPFDTYSRACYGPLLLCRYSDEEPPAIAADVLQLGDVSYSAIRPATRQVRWAEDW